MEAILVANEMSQEQMIFYCNDTQGKLGEHESASYFLTIPKHKFKSYFFTVP